MHGVGDRDFEGFEKKWGHGGKGKRRKKNSDNKTNSATVATTTVAERG